MARQMAVPRKGGVVIAISHDAGEPKDGSPVGVAGQDSEENDPEAMEGPEVVACPECGCQFDANQHKVADESGRFGKAMSEEMQADEPAEK